MDGIELVPSWYPEIAQMPPRVRSSKLKAESLEARQMMAGDVSAFAVGRFLYVTGDTQGNGVAITDDGSGNLSVIGLDQAGGATTINGNASQTFSRIKDIVIAMGKGDDAVAITAASLAGNLYVSGGQGNDAIGLGDFTDTGLFDDAVDALLGTLNVKKSVILSGDDGDDTILAQDVAIRKSLVITTGIGDDTVRIDSGPGVTAKSFTLSTSAGDDTISLANLSTTKSLVISTGTGNDEVTLNQVSAKSLVVSLDPGDDNVRIEDSTVTKTALLSGSSGTNGYTSVGTNSFGKLVRKNIATIV